MGVLGLTSPKAWGSGDEAELHRLGRRRGTCPGNEGVGGAFVLEGQYIKIRSFVDQETWRLHGLESLFSQEVFIEISQGIVQERGKRTWVWVEQGFIGSCSLSGVSLTFTWKKAG